MPGFSAFPAFFSADGMYTDLCRSALDKRRTLHSITPICVIKAFAVARHSKNDVFWKKTRTRENNNHAAAASAPSYASDPDRRLADAHPQHGAAPVARHLHAAADARRRHLHLPVHARDRGPEPRLGLPAAAGRRLDGALRLPARDDRGLAALYRRPDPDG